MQGCKGMGLKAEISQLPHKRKSYLEHLHHSLLFNLYFTLSLSFSLPAPTASRLPFKSNSDFHFSHVSSSSHESWFRFRVSSRYSATHFKIKIRFSMPLLTQLKLKTLISLSYKWVFTECSLFSLLSIDFKTSPFYFKTNTRFPLYQNELLVVVATAS